MRENDPLGSVEDPLVVKIYYMMGFRGLTTPGNNRRVCSKVTSSKSTVKVKCYTMLCSQTHVIRIVNIYIFES